MDQPDFLRLRQLYCMDGSIIGTVVDLVACDDQPGVDWLVVETEVLGSVRLVPAALVRDIHGRLSVPFGVDVVTSSPIATREGPPPPGVARQLQEHYGIVSG